MQRRFYGRTGSRLGDAAFAGGLSDTALSVGQRPLCAFGLSLRPSGRHQIPRHLRSVLRRQRHGGIFHGVVALDIAALVVVVTAATSILPRTVVIAPVVGLSCIVVNVAAFAIAPLADPAAMRQLFADTGWIWPEALPLLVEHSPGFAEQPVVLRRQ